MKLLKRMLRVASVLTAVGASLAVGIGDGHAGLGLRVDLGNNGSFESTVQDNGAGDLLPVDVGLLSASYLSGPLVFNLGVSKPNIGTPINPAMDLSSVIITSGPTDIKIQLSDTDFDGLPFGVGQLVSIGGTITAAPGSYVTTKIYRDLSNTQFGTGAGTLICSTGPLAANLFDVFGGGCGAFMVLDDAYSITIETIIHLTGNKEDYNHSIVSYDAHFRLASDGELEVPEPASLMLLGFGVLGVGAWRRRRKAQQD
jgi:hypothetical protein